VFRKALELAARITALDWKSRDEEHDTQYRNPDDLGRTPTPLTNALMIGSCLAEMFAERAPKSLRKVDYVFFNNWARLPDAAIPGQAGCHQRPPITTPSDTILRSPVRCSPTAST
jgi:hypothetical protein